MQFDDTHIDAIIWESVRQSINPADFQAYLDHRPANAAHLQDAAERLEQLSSSVAEAPSQFSEAVDQIRALATNGDATAQFHMGKFYNSGRGVVEDAAVAAQWYAQAAAHGELRATHNLANLKMRGHGVAKDVDDAVRLYEKCADAGDPAGVETLGNYFSEDEHRDVERACRFLRRAYSLGSLSAGTRLGRLLYEQAKTRADRQEAISTLAALVEQNHMPAAWTLARVYSDGNLRDRDYEAAKSLHLRLLEAGFPESMLSLGWLDLQTPPTEDSPAPEPLHWFKKAWEAGLPEAAGYIGRAFLYGEGVDKSADDALHWFTLGADKEEAGCAYFVGLIHENGWVGEASDIAAEPWYRQAAENGSSIAQIALARLLVRNREIPVNGTEAVRWLTIAIEAGKTEAMLLLAHLYREGIGVIKNEKAAFDLCYQAALAGDLTGQSEVAWRLCRGIGCDQDFEEGVKWHQKAASGGRAFDQGVLAYSYLYGQLSLEQNVEEAVKWARLSATQGNDFGELVLGLCYYGGYGITQDTALACEWLTKAAEQGNVRAQAKLAEHYYYGEDGDGRNLLEAGRWASQAADAEHPTAQLLLGRMFLFGEQVEYDPKAAIEWFRLSAEQGNSEAMYWVGQLTADGIGTQRDWMIALKWLKKASDAGVEAAVKALKSFGVEYVPGSQNQHRLSPDDPLVLDSNVDAQSIEGQWVCITDEAKMAYTVRPDGTFSCSTELGAAEPMTCEGRWAVRGTKLIWDAWESNIPLEDPASMDDELTFINEFELHLTGSDGNTLKFIKTKPTHAPDGQVVAFSKEAGARR